MLIVWLPAIYGERAVLPSVRMAVAGVVGLLLYKYLKSRLVRERPYISLSGIVPGTPARAMLPPGQSSARPWPC